MLNVASGGAAEREASDVAVKPVGDPSDFFAVTTEMPAPWRLNASRKIWLGESSLMFIPLSLEPDASGLLDAPDYDGDIMIRVVDLRGLTVSEQTAHGFVPRYTRDSSEVLADVRELMLEVRSRGESALLDHAERFDGVRPSSLVVEESTLRAARNGLDRDVRKALEESVERVRAASEEMLPKPHTTRYHAGGSVTTRYVPVARAGVYVPGGKAVYPSSVVMNVVAAQVAGVQEIVVVSPAQREFAGAIHPTIAAVAAVLGVTEVYAMGGASAVAALAYGVPEIGLAPVSMITGPGNAYVAAAKREVQGLVGIDSEAGPTEIGIIADDTANPEFIAVDLISQAEHDERAQAVLITTSAELAERVLKAVERRVPDVKHRERVSRALEGEQSALMIVDSLGDAVVMSNAIAPEHLEVMVEDPSVILPLLTNAGAIFVGDYTPVSVGDYAAGSNHVLPTGGTAKFSSGLSPLTFLRTQQVVEYDKDALGSIAETVITLSGAEDLPAHGDAVSERFRDEN